MATKATPRKRATSSPAKAAKKTPAKKTGAAKSSRGAAPASKKKTAPSTSKSGGAKRTAASPKRPETKAKSAAKSRAPRPVRAAAADKKYRPFGQLLMRKQAELTQAYAVSKTDTRDRLDDGTEDYIDYAVNSYAKDFMLSLTELERQQLQLVREALHRLNRGEYGSCLQCGVEIPMKRLEVSPWVRYCIQCQELEDQGLLPQHAFAQFDEEDGAFAEDIDEEIDVRDDEGEEDEEEEEESEDEEATVPVSSGADDEDDATGLEIDDSEE